MGGVRERHGLSDGDRVRVTFEGYVEDAGHVSLRVPYIGGGKGQELVIFTEDESLISLEKAPAPLVKFQTGDTLRRRSDSALVIVTEGGYTYLDTGKHYEFTNPGARGRDEFNSREYAKVELEERPF